MHIKSENTAAQYRATVPLNADMLVLYYDMSLILFLSWKICLNETLSRHWFGCHKASSGVWNRSVYDNVEEKRDYEENITVSDSTAHMLGYYDDVRLYGRNI